MFDMINIFSAYEIIKIWWNNLEQKWKLCLFNNKYCILIFSIANYVIDTQHRRDHF
jgi:hypothetical protein